MYLTKGDHLASRPSRFKGTLGHCHHYHYHLQQLSLVDCISLLLLASLIEPKMPKDLAPSFNFLRRHFFPLFLGLPLSLISFSLPCSIRASTTARLVRDGRSWKLGWGWSSLLMHLVLKRHASSLSLPLLRQSSSSYWSLKRIVAAIILKWCSSGVEVDMGALGEEVSNSTPWMSREKLRLSKMLVRSLLGSEKYGSESTNHAFNPSIWIGENETHSLKCFQIESLDWESIRFIMGDTKMVA